MATWTEEQHDAGAYEPVITNAAAAEGSYLQPAAGGGLAGLVTPMILAPAPAVPAGDSCATCTHDSSTAAVAAGGAPGPVSGGYISTPGGASGGVSYARADPLSSTGERISTSTAATPEAAAAWAREHRTVLLLALLLLLLLLAQNRES